MRDDEIKVSVIIPVYNAQATLEETIRSALDQSMKDIEVICIDNGSQDRSMEIIRQFAEMDSRVIAAQELEQGSGPARNHGLALARGEFIAFLDADDFLPEHDSYERLYEAAQREQADIVGGKMMYVANGTYDEEMTKQALLYPLIAGRAERYIAYRDYQNDYAYQSFLFRRALLETHHLRFPHYLRHQDPPFFVRAMIAAEQFWVVDLFSYAYRCAYKNMRLSYEATMDAMQGSLDVLQIAKEHHLDRLGEIESEHCQGYGWFVYQNLKPGALNMLLRVLQLNQAVQEARGQDVNLVGFSILDEIFSLPQKLADLQQAYQERCEELHKACDVVDRKCWMFPYERIPAGSTIVLYGAGDVGQDFHAQLDATGYCKIAAWIDGGWESLGDVRISSPAEIQRKTFDYVVVASVKKAVQESMVQTLRNLGVEQEKIVIGSEAVE